MTTQEKIQQVEKEITALVQEKSDLLHYKGLSERVKATSFARIEQSIRNLQQRRSDIIAGE